MDVSYMLWDFVYIVAHSEFDEIKNHRMYQVFESASFLNRTFYLDEGRLLNSKFVTAFPKGVLYNHVDACYQFRDIHALLYGSVEMLRESVDLDNNPDALDKLERLESAIQALKSAMLMDDITCHIARMKL